MAHQDILQCSLWGLSPVVWCIRMEPAPDVAANLVVAARQDVRHVAPDLVNVSWRARPGSPRVVEGKQVILAEALERANATADLSLQVHTVEAVEVRTS